LSNTPILLVQLLDLEQNFFSFLDSSFVSVQDPPCRKVALQQVEEGQVGGEVVVVGPWVVVVVTGVVVVDAKVVVIVVEVITRGVSPVVVVIVVVPVVVAGLVVVEVFLTAQQRHVPCPGSGVHLST